jgi:hypothetical protein
MEFTTEERAHIHTFIDSLFYKRLYGRFPPPPILKMRKDQYLHTDKAYGWKAPNSSP